MTISELIIRLECEKKLHGDLSVCVPVAELNFEITHIHFELETFMRRERAGWRMSQTEACFVLE